MNLSKLAAGAPIIVSMVLCAGHARAEAPADAPEGADAEAAGQVGGSAPKAPWSKNEAPPEAAGEAPAPSASLTPLQAQLVFEAERRDADAAFTLSFILGFGAGHFYSEQWVYGIGAAGLQSVGLILLGVGIAVADGAGRREGDIRNTGELLAGVGGVTTGAARLADAFLAPYSAHARNRRILEELKLVPLVGSVESGAPNGIALTGTF